MDAYLLVKLAHVLLAILALGYNFSYAVWRALARGDREHLRFTLAGIQTLEGIANAGYGCCSSRRSSCCSCTGSPSRRSGSRPRSRSTSSSRSPAPSSARAWPRERALLETVGPGDPAYRAVESRATLLGITMTVLVVAIVFPIGVKPTP